MVRCNLRWILQDCKLRRNYKLFRYIITPSFATKVKMVVTVRRVWAVTMLIVSQSRGIITILYQMNSSWKWWISRRVIIKLNYVNFGDKKPHVNSNLAKIVFMLMDKKSWENQTTLSLKASMPPSWIVSLVRAS